VLHRLLFAHALELGPPVPLCTGFELHSPWLCSLYVPFRGLQAVIGKFSGTPVLIENSLCRHFDTNIHKQVANRLYA
jgi:hypothetical protein